MAPLNAIRVVQVLEAMEGGTRRYLRELVACLAVEGFDVRVVCSLGRDPRAAEDVPVFQARGARVTVLPMVRSPDPVRDLHACLRLRRMLVREPCDILHLHSSKAGWIGRIAALGLPCKVIYTPHGFSFLQRDPWFRRSACLLAERLAASRTDLLLAVSESEAMVAADKGLCRPENVQTLRNAVSVEAWKGEPRGMHAEDCSPVIVGLLGDPRPQKDPFTFLRAVKRVILAGAEARFLLPWSKPVHDGIRFFLRENDLERHVELVPCPDGLGPLHERIHIGVLPSRWEGLPFALLDALGLGIPVVGSDIPPLREVLGQLDARLLFPAGDDHALGDRLLFWMREPVSHLSSLRLRCRDLVSREYDIRLWREGIRRTYREVARRGLASRS
jgi:glycosyltransferase involved in cell wall biosynthesis